MAGEGVVGVVGTEGVGGVGGWLSAQYGSTVLQWQKLALAMYSPGSQPHLSKAASSMLVTEPGIVTLTRLVQPLKELAPMLVTKVGIATPASFLQS